MNWIRQHPNGTIVVSMLGLLFFLWGMAYPLSFAPAPIGPAAADFAKGTTVTVYLTVLSGLIGTVLGVLGGLGRLSSVLPIRWFWNLYVWVFRGTPLLLQILFVWLVVPPLTAGFWDISDFACAVIALSLNIGAYNTECVRAGIMAVPAGQIEAAHALGLNKLQTFKDIIFPQSLRVALPALANNLASLVKDSSLAYAISVVELTMVGYRVQATSYQPIPVFLTSALVYLILTTAFTTMTSALEVKLDVGRKR